MKSRIYVLHIIGMLCIAHSLTLLPPMLVSFWFHDGELEDFFITFLLLIISGFLLWAPFRHQTIELKRSDAFLVVPLFWMILSLASALPFIIGGALCFFGGFFLGDFRI